MTRSEPTEFSSMGANNRITAAVRRAERTRPAQNFAGGSFAAAALDAAFDSYVRLDVDSQPTAAPHGDHRTIPTALIADISSQLDILDRQRKQLAALLRDAK